LVTTFDTATLVGQPPRRSVLDAPSVTAFDDAPTLSVTSAAATFTESATNPASANNTPVTLLSGSTVGDPDGAGMAAGATVSISSGFLTGDLLSVTVTGTNITVQSNAGGVLVLTGTDTFANYQTVLNSVQYTSTSENPTNYGADTSRTITWSVTDGVLNNPTSITTTVAVAGNKRRAGQHRRRRAIGQ
jgi:hypothetical protein